MTRPGHTPESPETPDAAAAASSSCCGGHGAHEDLGTPTTSRPDEPALESDRDIAGDDMPDQAPGGSGCCGGHAHPEAKDAAADEATDGDGSDVDDLADEAEPQRDELAEAIEAQQRLAAEYANYRRRMERDRQANAVAAKATVFAELLPILDDLDLAKKHGDLSGPLKAVNDKLRAACTKHDLTQFGEEGDVFNPEVHEAVQDASSTDNKVLGAVLRPGFMIGDRLVRTAMVTIADGE